MTLYYGGFTYDFLTQIVSSGTVGFKKGHGGMGMNYIICVQGLFPTGNAPASSYGGFVGEIRITTGTFAPSGWMLCQGQELVIRTNTALYSLLGTTYGATTDSTFKIPDLRGRVAVGVGTHPGGLSWERGDKSH